MYLPDQAGADRWYTEPAAVPAEHYDLFQVEDHFLLDEYEQAVYRIEQFAEACEECGLWEEEHTCGRGDCVFLRRSHTNA